MTDMTRRGFVAGMVAAAAAPALILGKQQATRYPIAFSTLGCPKWPWSRILEQAAAMGYAAVELRGIEGQMDLTKRPEFIGTRLAQSMKDLEAVGPRRSRTSARPRACTRPSPRPARRRSTKAAASSTSRTSCTCRTSASSATRCRPGEPKASAVARVVDGLRTLGEHAKGSTVGVIIESHGDFTDSPTLLEILKTAAMPNVALLWDAHHTFVAGKEDPATTFKALGSYVRHTHLKDSKPEGAGVRYVLTGDGTVPVRDTVNVLARSGYRGYYGFEWEKAWHPEIEEPEVAFPHYAALMRRYLTEAGVAPTAV